MKNFLFLFAMIVLMTGCETNKKADLSGTSPVIVKTAKIESSKSELVLNYSGTVEASCTVPLTFQRNGVVSRVNVEEGDMIRKGQVLAVIDNADQKNLYDAANSKYIQAQDAYDRLKKVHDSGSLPEIKWVEMETNLKEAASQLEFARSGLAKCELIAPDDGVVGKRNIQPGQYSLSMTAPIELVKINTVNVKISVPENEINSISKGSVAKVKIAALNDSKFDGLISNIGVVADKISRTYDVKILLKNDNMNIKPGMVCNVSLNLKHEGKILLIPYCSVSIDKDGKSFVFIMPSGQQRVRKQIITVGNYDGSSIEVLSGLELGQTIIVEGKEKLSDNSLISL